MATIREYIVTKYTSANYTATCAVPSVQKDKTIYSQIPTLEEMSTALGEEIRYVRLNSCFSNCASMITSPRIEHSYVVNEYNIFRDCASLRIAPGLGKPNYSLMYAFGNCTALINPPTIPNDATTRASMFLNCTNLPYFVSVPPLVTNISSMFSGCTKATGEMIIRPSSFASDARYSDTLYDTTKPITLYGDKSLCEAIAATANNGNATWQPWYQPVPAVTDRGQGSYTTADDMTRMVRNGALAVSSYAPARMVYHQGDIVRADEWQALVEAAQTIDSSITTSTNYANLNKIEAAFDSAL